MKKEKRKLIILYICSFFISILPLVICFFCRVERYVKERGDGVKLSVGGIILLVFFFMKAIGKLKMPRRVVAYGVIFVMAYLLGPIIEDALLLSGMALLGESVDYIVFAPWIKRTREDISVKKSAATAAKEVDRLIEQRFGGRI